MFRKFFRTTALVLLGLAASRLASAQGLETLGSRASGMAAFVAVADDASAVAWNPAGLVGGPIFNLQIDLGRATEDPDAPGAPRATAKLRNTALIALGTTPVGLAYYRLASTSFTTPDPAGTETPDRQHRRVSARTLVTSHLGATVQQSLGDYVTVGATIKLVRGSVGTAALDVSSWEDAFERADTISRDGSTRGDVDLGAMLAAGQIKLGVVVRNTTAPTFGSEDDPARQATLERQVRVGAAWGSRWPGLSPTIVAVDVDLSDVADASGDRRDVAAGVERWLAGRRVGVRGGVRASTLGAARAVVSAGGSYALRAGTYIDVFVARGREDARAWGLAARLTY